MKKTLVISVAALMLSPLVAQAAWWNPFTWGKASTATTTNDSVMGPSHDDLMIRVAELEEKLDVAREKIAILSKLASSTMTAPVVSTPAPSTKVIASKGLSQEQIVSKLQPAVVLVSTTSPSVGVIINTQGYVLTNARAVFTKNSSGVVTGILSSIPVTLYNGTKKNATVVGFDEALDLAVLDITGGGTFPYATLSYSSGAIKDATAYVFGFPSYVSGSVSRVDGSAIEITSATKPADGGGVVVNNTGGVVGLAGTASCKLLQEMTTCLEYATLTRSAPDRIPKLISGMRLYRSVKPDETSTETLVRGQLEGMYTRASSSFLLSYAIGAASGKNSFDYFNSKLGDDADGKITKIYLLKLKTIAEEIANAMDFLKSEAYNLNVFFIDNSSAISGLGDYERATLTRIQSVNSVRLKQYEADVDLWTKKKNEYDAYAADPTNVTHDYLMEQGVYVEHGTEYVSVQRNAVLSAFSGEDVAIF